MIPIVLGVAAGAALLLSRDNRREDIYSSGSPEQAPIDFLGEDRTGDSRAFARDVYVRLRQAGVTDREIDRGYYVTGVPTLMKAVKVFDAPIGSEDYRIHELEVFRTALDLYEQAPNESMRKIIADFPTKAASFEQAARLRFYRNSEGKADPQTVQTQRDYLQRAVNLDRSNLEAMHRLMMLSRHSDDHDNILEAAGDLLQDKYGSPIERAIRLHLRDFEARDHSSEDPVESASNTLHQLSDEKTPPPVEDVEFATKIYDELRRRAPNDPAHHLNYGILKFHSGLSEQAEAAYRDVLKITSSLPDPLPLDHGLAHLYLGILLQQNSNLEAMDHFLAALVFFKSRDPFLHSKALGALGMILTKQADQAYADKNMDKYLPLLGTFVKLAQEPLLYLLQGDVLLQIGKLSEAAESYSQAVRRDSGKIGEEARDQIKRILATLGDDRESREIRQRYASILDPGTPL